MFFLINVCSVSTGCVCMRNWAATAQDSIERSEVQDVENSLLHCKSGTAKN